MVRAVLTTSALVLVLSSCSASSAGPNNAAASEAAVVVSVTASAPLASASVRPTIEPLAVPKSEDIVCELVAANAIRPPPLRLKPDGLSFASIFQVKDVHVLVPKDPATNGILLHAVAGPVDLTGLTLASELTVFAHGEPMLAGIFVPDGSTPLRFISADVGVVRVGMPTPPVELTDLTVPLDAKMTCKDVSLEWGKGDVTKTFKTHEAGLLVGETIPLAADAKGKPLTAILPPVGLREVTILEKGATTTRIAYSLRAGWVIGWVPQTAVKPGKPRPGSSSSGALSGIAKPRPGKPRESRVCDRVVDLGVELEGAAAIVGRIQPGAKLDLYDDDGERVRVHVQGAELKPSDGARLFVRSVDIKSCPLGPPDTPQP